MCVCVLAVLELNEEKHTAGETQQKEDLNCDVQTQMTSFEMNLKDKRFVAAIVRPLRVSEAASLV